MSVQYALDDLIDGRLPRGLGGRFYGVYAALVIDINDHDGKGKVKIKLPWSHDSEGNGYEAWARLATVMAGNNRGSWFVPDVNTEVLVTFEAGDPRHPYVIGSLWNGVDLPPDSMDSEGNNYRKTFRSRNGVKITLDDTDGREVLSLETPAGQSVILKDGQNSIEIKDSNGNFIKMEKNGITVHTDQKLTLQAQTVEVSAPTVTVVSGTSKFNGLVQINDTVTNTVVSSSYLPGAGNIW